MAEKYFTDQMGTILKMPESPQSIISLVPSQTELLFDLGLEREVKGITKFCVHPSHWRKEKSIIGGTKKFDFDIIHGLKPDFIFGNKEENYEEGIDELAKHYPVWMSDINTLQDAFSMIQEIGKAVRRESRAETLINQIKIGFAKLKPSYAKKRAMYFIWQNPWMVAGTKTFIHDMLQYAGFENCITASRYPHTSIEEIQDLQPDVLLLSSEPYPFKASHVLELKAIAPKAKIHIVDGEMFSWYGSRLRYAPDYFLTLQKLMV